MIENRLWRGRVLWMGVVVATVAPAQADQAVRIMGTVTGAADQQPLANVKVLIKNRAANSQPIGDAVTGSDGGFVISATAKGPNLTCEAHSAGHHVQRVTVPARSPVVCNFDLESLVVLSEMKMRSATVGGGPAVTFLVATPDQVQLSRLTVRLHLRRAATCGSDGTTHTFTLGSAVTVLMGAAAGTIANGGHTFQASGAVSFRQCSSTVVSLDVAPAALLVAGTQPIVLELPAKLALMSGGSRRLLMSLGASTAAATYDSSIERVDIELVTARNSMVTDSIGGLSIPTSAR